MERRDLGESGCIPRVKLEPLHSEPVNVFLVSQADKGPLAQSLYHADRPDGREGGCIASVGPGPLHSEPANVFLVSQADKCSLEQNPDHARWKREWMFHRRQTRTAPLRSCRSLLVN